jgi:hypothetical protein
VFVDFYDKLKEEFLHFQEAEKAIKSSEIIVADVYTVALNQLRYASNHLIQHIKQLHANDIDAAIESLLKYRRHCTRAYYDAYDAEATFILAQYGKFYQYASDRGVSISTLFSEKYESWSVSSKNLSNFIINGQFDTVDKQSKYKEIKSYLEACQACGLYDLHWAYDKVNDYLKNENKVNAENAYLKKIAFWSLVVGAVGIGFTVLGLLLPDEFKNAKCHVITCEQSNILKN